MQRPSQQEKQVKSGSFSIDSSRPRIASACPVFFGRDTLLANGWLRCLSTTQGLSSSVKRALLLLSAVAVSHGFRDLNMKRQMTLLGYRANTRLPLAALYLYPRIESVNCSGESDLAFSFCSNILSVPAPRNCISQRRQRPVFQRTVASPRRGPKNVW